jgi:hypothetical protein
MSGPVQPVSVHDIADPLAWARRLADTGPAADPHEKSAYLAAKADLLARIRATHPHQETS